MNSYKLRLLRKLAFFIAFIILTEALMPATAYALTAGPSAPEFSTFTPVATSDMVNVFSGDLNYNLPVVEIPGSDGGGYAMSLSYNCGVSSEEESSWVGFGWNLNPGSINRNVRGFPDDYKNAPITFFNKSRPNWSITSTRQVGIQIFGKDAANVGVSASVVTRVNNNQGYYISKGFGFSVGGLGLNMNTDPNGTTYSYDINVARLVKGLTKKNKESAENEQTTKSDKTNNRLTWEEAKKQSGANANTQLSTQNAISGYANSLGSSYGLFSYSDVVKGAALTEYKGFAFNNSGLSGTVNVYVPIGIHKTFLNSTFNIQYNKYRSENTASGYMYNNGGGHRDYYVEKDIAFSPRTYFLGVPFNNSDVFNVSGEGIGGGFKFLPNNVGSFSPDPVVSTTNIFQVGIELIVSQNVGVGIEFGVGVEKNTVREWIGGDFLNSDGIFRFNNDMGGTASYGSTGIDAASMVWSPLTPPGSKVVDAAASSFTLNESGRSSYVDHHTYANVGNGFTNDYHGTGPTDAVAEIAVYNQDGMRYVYGKPVKTRNETNLQVDTKASETTIKNRYLAFRNVPLYKSGTDYDVTEDALANDSYKVLTGEIKKQPYASSYLLTALTTHDYVDANSNGLDNADFGGWTKLSYKQAYGDSSASGSWYRYRSPYNGLLYQQNQVSDVWDDVGSVVTGEKEVEYLEKIETKTHIAYFVTNKTVGPNIWTMGSGKSRLDALSAADLAGGVDPAAKQEGLKGNKEPEYLEKIVLFAKGRMDKPVKVVRFEYDYSLVQNIPNNYNGDFPAQRNDANNTYNTSSNPSKPSASGKLTLKKVWFEYEGTIPSKVSPYEFKYEYANSGSFAPEISSEYNNILTYGNQFSQSAQNPDYTPYLMDQWGCVQPYGEERHNDNINTHYQGKLPITQKGTYGWRSRIGTAVSYDPAAWNLKAIKLPSGGEIHIQYEEKDYKHVQDREVMAQASIIKGGYSEDHSYNDIPIQYEKATITDQPFYIVNAADLGANPTVLSEVDTLVQKINRHFRANGDGTSVAQEKINFKFLYSLNRTAPSLDVCTSEYISGYANFIGASIATLSSGGYGVKITMGAESAANGQYASIPRQACVKYVTTQREEKLNGPNCESGPESAMEPQMRSFANKYQGSFSLQQAIDQVKLGFSSKIKQYGDNMLSAQSDLYDHYGYQMDDICLQLKEESSFIKLPILGAKKGGGIRVKRLLMYDPGIEKGDAALYGSEYAYVLEDGTSSGVATNEPSAGREENPLVVFLPKKGQNWFSRITAGEDKDQSEGPIGESLLPSPSIGHSRIVVKNIHQGLSGTGFTIHQYYTAQDYPYDRFYNTDNINGSGVSSTNLSEAQTKDRLSLPAGLFNFTLTRFWSVQGFRFIVNSMHGQLKNISTYGGVYNPSDPSTSYLTSAKEYRYFEPGEAVPMMTRDEATGGVKFVNGHPGKEMEMAMESRTVSDVTFDFKLGIDISITISWVPPIFVTVSPSFNLNDELINTHVTSKVIRYPAIVKSVMSYQDGIYSLSENLAFDDLTGQPGLVRTFDSYHKVQLGDAGTVLDGSVYNFNIPAAYKYTGMGQKAISTSNTNQLNEHTAMFVSYSTPGDPRNTGWLNAPKNVISASIQTFANGWNSSWNDDYIKADYPGITTTGTQTKLANIWRPSNAYVYKADSVALANHGSKVYKGGYFNIDKPFNWSSEISNTIASQTGWLKSSSITRYSPHGLALEEVNAIGIYSANKFGYNQRMVTMSGQNAHYGNLYFEDFENSVTASSVFAHSGKKSLLLTTSTISGHMDTLVTNGQGVEVTPELNKGGLLKLWVKQATPSVLTPVVLSAQVGTGSYPMDKVTSTGEWSLYSVRIPKAAFYSNGEIGLNFNQSIYIDDVRFQPFEAQATCYVYDIETLRPLVIFDDQHFGMYYQYNSEGKLVRKLVETEEGLKTIQETQYNTPRVARSAQ